MQKKTTLRQQFLRAGLLMLVLALAMGLGVIVVVMVVFCQKVPDGGEVFGRQPGLPLWQGDHGPQRHGALPGAGGGGPVPAGGGDVHPGDLPPGGEDHRPPSRPSAGRRTTSGTGELDFQILSCDLRELDELSQSLESVRQRLKASALAEAGAQEERGLLMANLSHDLRTPITAIKGYVEGIQDGIANTPEKQRHYLDIVYSKSLVLERLVRNMSDFSEYELGRMQYHFEYVDMGPFLRDLGEEYAEDARQNQMTFTSQIPPGEHIVTADRGKLKRVLDNLVSNAVKYGRPGGAIALTAEEYEKGLVIQVSDNGKGISPPGPGPCV